MSKPFTKLKGTTLGLDDQLGFGRHKGYTILEILKDRPAYITWLIANTDLKFYQSVHEELYKYTADKAPAKYHKYFVGYDHDTLGDWGDPFDDVPF